MTQRCRPIPRALTLVKIYCMVGSPHVPGPSLPSFKTTWSKIGHHSHLHQTYNRQPWEADLLQIYEIKTMLVYVRKAGHRTWKEMNSTDQAVRSSQRRDEIGSADGSKHRRLKVDVRRSHRNDVLDWFLGSSSLLKTTIKIDCSSADLWRKGNKNVWHQLKR
jgi:hypothetical protein